MEPSAVPKLFVMIPEMFATDIDTINLVVDAICLPRSKPDMHFAKFSVNNDHTPIKFIVTYQRSCLLPLPAPTQAHSLAHFHTQELCTAYMLDFRNFFGYIRDSQTVDKGLRSPV